MKLKNIINEELNDGDKLITDFHKAVDELKKISTSKNIYNGKKINLEIAVKHLQQAVYTLKHK